MPELVRNIRSIEGHYHTDFARSIDGAVIIALLLISARGGRGAIVDESQ
jgi:hypothetical protein